MVFGNEYEDEGDERNFGRAEERDDGEQPVSVPAAVERLERVARARVSRDPLSVVEQAPVSDEGAAEPQGVATTGINLESDVWRELFVDEAKETEEEEKGRSATGVTVKTEVREEPEWGPPRTDGYDSEYYIAHEAYDSAYEAEHEEDDVVTSERSRAGSFHGTLGRKSDGPTVPRLDGVGALRVRKWTGTRAVSKAAMLLNLREFSAVTSAASTAPGRPALKVSSTLATGASAVTQGGSSMSRRATAAPVGSRQKKPVAVSVEDIKGTDKKKSEVKTVVEATVASEEVVIAEREKTDVDAELSVAEKKVAVVGDVKEVVRSVEAAEEVGAVCEVSRTVGEAPVEDEKEVFWDAVESVSEEPEVALVAKVNMINKHKSKDEGVSFPRIRFAPRLFAAPPLKFALKKLEVVITDWRPSEDAGVDLGQEEGSEEAPEVSVFSDGEVDVSVGQVDPASRGEATEDSRTKRVILATKEPF
ncbi:hypothetical protein GQ600_14261 [Phytophthora cactorum]|nr:hypothetical protein GQ600_14261 [Phytophthora cactorum]